MGLRDLLRKKDEVAQGGAGPEMETTFQRLNGPEFKLVRSDTHTHDIIHAPDFPDHPHDSSLLSAQEPSRKSRRSLDVFRSGARSRSRSDAAGGGDGGSSGSSSTRRLSQRLHLSREPQSSDAVPQDLPDIVLPSGGGGGADGIQDRDGAESQWEQRATMLASQNERARSRPSSAGWDGAARPRGRSPSASRVVSSKSIDADIQEAIRLHEEGDLEHSTKLFGQLADPDGANNPLSQVLYGLALRHGWGCTPDQAGAVRYLSAAASNAASVEQMALQAGLKKGGAAKGELVLAIFELANCFRHGWGIATDPIAAKQASCCPSLLPASVDNAGPSLLTVGELGCTA
ncbi:hypothetical protein S7711_08946 [Stachybotrys chartarum IBT 7711]|uniref:Uncharacterized protein n=1 Tax=Stachybotrys chartarum (strain CBS 109288 / IBT 7711) TaxID=1280523 RepID=A0A084AI18_STACB|nr:hypothetical protein S7711_08946 [Stachybotrys chartarum IBT 7711]KFA72534.1 hypothetical protein S40288_07856 [Stachybotrys chartarum IBT 40288]